MGSKLDFESEYKKGTTFFFNVDIPLDSSESAKDFYGYDASFDQCSEAYDTINVENVSSKYNS